VLLPWGDLLDLLGTTVRTCGLTVGVVVDSEEPEEW
jgi:hypothetical protein